MILNNLSFPIVYLVFFNLCKQITLTFTSDFLYFSNVIWHTPLTRPRQYIISLLLNLFFKWQATISETTIGQMIAQFFWMVYTGVKYGNLCYPSVSCQFNLIFLGQKFLHFIWNLLYCILSFWEETISKRLHHTTAVSHSSFQIFTVKAKYNF